MSYFLRGILIGFVFGVPGGAMFGITLISDFISRNQTAINMLG